MIAVDTSGPIDQATLDVFAAEANGILECNPCRVEVVYCDARVQHVDEWTPGEGPLTLATHGGGGTDHSPVWEHVSQMDEEPAAIVCLTDGLTDVGTPPDVPVLWAIVGNPSFDAPFGRILHVT